MTADAHVSDRWFYQVMVKAGGKFPGTGGMTPVPLDEDNIEIEMINLSKENEKAS